MRRELLAAVVLSVVALTVASCTATQSMNATSASPNAPGFLLGLWHGFIAPISFIVSLFSDTVRVYAVPNVGRWYDFGFMIGISGFSGGVFAGRRHTKREKRKD